MVEEVERLPVVEIEDLLVAIQFSAPLPLLEVGVEVVLILKEMVVVVDQEAAVALTKVVVVDQEGLVQRAGITVELVDIRQ